MVLVMLHPFRSQRKFFIFTDKGVNCYAADPGGVKTDIQSKASGIVGWVAWGMHFFFKSPEDGAQVRKLYFRSI